MIVVVVVVVAVVVVIAVAVAVAVVVVAAVVAAVVGLLWMYVLCTLKVYVDYMYRRRDVYSKQMYQINKIK